MLRQFLKPIFIFALFLIFATKAQAYTPPIGIPAPSFGIDELAPIAPVLWSSGVSGFYYVCPTCTGNTDISNAYGYPALPRATIPNPIPAGSVVELHGRFDGNYLSVYSNGTSEQPVFIRGVPGSEPTITKEFRIAGNYTIVENIISAPIDANDIIFGLPIREGFHHIAVRNSEFYGNLRKAGGIGLGTWSYNGTSSLSNVVLYNLNMHDLGDPSTVVDQDKHCVTVNGSVNNLWLVDSELARCSGDGIQIEAQQGKRDKINHVYIGRNTSHNHVQTGAWVKHAMDVVISQNTFYGARSGPYTVGAGTGMQYGPEYIWFINNKIYDNNIGIFVASNDPPGDGIEVFIVGNLIYNTHNPANPANPYNSGCMSIRGSTNRYIVNNTCYDYDSGLNALSSTGKYLVYNNIFANRTSTSTFDIYAPMPSSGASEVQNNIFYSTDGVRINWNGSTKTSLALFQSSTGKGQNCTVADPVFNDSVDNNFHLKSDSPAINTGMVHSVYDIFQSRYGIDIARDVDDVIRPQGAGWDLGAFEYASLTPPTSDATPPSVPDGVSVI